MTKFKAKPELWLLLLLAFAAPIIGGHVPTDAQPIAGSLLTELLGGSALPIGTRFLLALLACVGLALAIGKNRVVQVVNIRVMGLLGLMIVLIGATVLFSKFPYLAVRDWLPWLLFGSVVVLTVAATGRERGPWAVVAALSAGTGVVALRGISEFLEIMSKEPTHRIFAGWNNPNAVASVLLGGALLSIGATIACQNRYRILFAVTGAANLGALVLTQSKGGLLAFAVALSVMLVAMLAAKVKFKAIGFGVVPVALGVLLAFGLATAAKSASQGGDAFARVANAGSTMEQSVGFRANLWKTGLEIAVHNPAGTGPGTFRYHSTQPGLVESTVFVHQAYLQLAAECGWVTLLAWLSLAGYWTVKVLSGSRKQPPERAALKLAVFGAMAGLAAHGFVESNLSFVGSMLMAALLFGLGLQLAIDATSPEALPQGPRYATILFGCVLPLIGFAVTAASEAKKASLLTSVATQDLQAVQQSAATLASGSYGDPEAAYLQALYGSTSVSSRASALKTASESFPAPKVQRAAAKALAEDGNLEDAVTVLDRVFTLDPNNIRAWLLKVELLDKSGRGDEAMATAEKALAVESTTSYKVRAIPEIVPTELLEIRKYLADHTSDPKARAQLLEPAVAGYLQFQRVTVPYISALLNGGPEALGFTKESLEEHRQKGRETAQALQAAYRDSGESGKAETLTKGLAELGG